ncbi:MAG: hypothetical protein WC787_05115 [Patescibacteria group bacterium]
MWYGLSLAILTALIAGLTPWYMLGPVLAAVVIVLVVPAFCLFIKRNVIGRYVWAYQDRSGNVHVHRLHPLGLTRSDNKETYFRLRLGGWWKECRIRCCAHPRWELEGWNGRDLVLRDSAAAGITLDAFSHLFWIVNNTSSVFNLVIAMDRDKMEKELHQAVDQAKLLHRQWDGLGVGIQKLVIFIEASKETMGKSRHAQEIRERIEKLMEGEASKRVAAWRKAAEEELAKEAQPAEVIKSSVS